VTTSTSRAVIRNPERPSFILHANSDLVLVPGWIAAIIEGRTNIAALRVQLRGINPVASAVLEDLRVAAARSSVSERETAQDTDGKPATRSLWLSTTEAAEELGLKRQSIGKAIRAGRLHATKINGSYRISRDNLRHYQGR
jgi:excisionase family DNA binding protein